MVNKEKVIEALRVVYDPEIPINVVDLGLIYDVEIEGGKVTVEMTMTMPGCPMAGLMFAEAKRKVAQLEGVEEVEVKPVWDPPWTPARISAEARVRLGLA